MLFNSLVKKRKAKYTVKKVLTVGNYWMVSLEGSTGYALLYYAL